MNVNYFKPLWRNTLVMLLFCFGLSSWGQTYLLQEGFSTTSLPSGWSGDIYFNTTANIGDLSGGNGAGFNANNKYLQTPSINSPGILTFNYKGSSSTSQISFKIQKSVNGGAFVDVKVFPKPHSNTVTEGVVEFNENSDNVVIKFVAFDRTGNSLYIDDIQLTQYENVTPTHTLTYTAVENGTIDGTSPQTVNEGEDGTAVTAVPNIGYSFVNWSDESTENPRTDTNVTEDISVTANFAINTYTITYDGNGNDGGSAPVDEDSPYNHGSNVTVLGQGSLTLTNHSFLGWNTQADGLGTAYAENDQINITSDITLYAQWLDDSLEPQTITFEPLANVTYGDVAFDLTATADSGLTVSYASSNENVATIDGNTVTIVGVGTTDITASQLGDGDYQPAVPVVQTLTVNQKNLTISGVIVADKPYDGTTTATINISGATLDGVVVGDDIAFATGTGEFSDVNAGENIAVTLTSNFTLTGTAAGNYTLTQPTLTGNINKANQTVTLSDLNAYLGGEAIDLPTVTDQGITIEYISDNESVATVEGNVLTIVGLGTTEIFAGNSGTANYNAFTDSFILTVTAPPSIYEDFTDGDFTNNPVWSGDTAGFTITTNETFPNGSASTDGFYLAGISGSGANYILTTPSTEINEWQFSLGSSSFSPSGTNYFGVILMASDPVSGLIADSNFTGYYLKLGANGSNDKIELIRKTGSGESSVGEFDVSVSSGLPNGLNIRVTRDENGTFELFYSTGFTLDETPTTSAGTLVNNIYTSSSYFGVYQAMSNDGDRRVYFDNLMITPPAPTAVVWTTANEWSNGDGPTVTDDVIIEGDNYVVVGNVAAKTLTVANGGKITIPMNAALTVEGKITNNGDFIINNEGVLYQNNYTGVNEGDIKVERDAKPMRRLDYTLWSSPVSGMLLNQFSNISNNGGTGTIWNRVYELGATAWESVWDSYANATASTETFATAKGYLYRAFNSYDPVETTIFTGEFTGVPNNGDYSINTPNMFDAIGNPYPSPVFAEDFFNANVGAGAIYFWTNVNSSNGVAYTHNNWASYTLAGGVGVQAEGVGEEIEVPNGWIHPGVGFVVYTEESTTSVLFNNSMRINTNGALGREMATEKSRFWLNLSNEEVTFNQILVGYMDNATQGVDTGIDGKMFAYEGNALYSIIDNNEDMFVIQGRALPFTASDVVALGFRAVNVGSFTISLANVDGLFAEGNTTIYLKDNFTQTQHNLNSGAYSFVSEEGIFDTRFEVVYQTTMSVENPVANNANWVVYSQENGFQVQTQGFELKTVQVFDLLGRTIYTANAQGTVHQIPALGADSVYIVKVTTTDNVVLSKKVK